MYGLSPMGASHRVCGIVVLGLAGAFGMQAAGAAEAWKPDGIAEIIVNTAPGSSPDKTARFMQKIFQQQGLVSIPATVVNKPGGGGAVAYTYLNQHEGSGNYIAVASKTLLTTHIMGRSHTGKR